MSLDEAVKILRENGYIVSPAPSVSKYRVYYGCDPEPDHVDNYHTPAQVIKLAKWEISNHFRGDLKHYDHRRDRHKTKQKIANEKYDDLSSNQQTHRENRWNWD